MEILFFAVLIETFLTLFSAILTMYFSGNILFRKRFNKKSKYFSPTITIYLWYQQIWGILQVIYCAYAILFWRPNSIIYDQKILFIFGFPFYIIMLANNVIEGFVGIDRCLCIIFPLRYKTNLKKVFGGITLIAFLLYIIVLIFANNFIEIFTKNLTTNCVFFGCIILQQRIPSVYFLKLFSIIITAIVGIILFGLIKFYLPNINNKDSKRMHITIVAVIISTVFFEVIPNAIGSVYVSITQIPLGFYLGPYSTCLMSMNIAFCSWIYFRTLKNTFKRVTYSGVITVLGSAKS